MFLKEKSIIEIDSNKFNKNIDSLFKISKQKIYLVIKSNAYGHGIREIAKLADQNIYISTLCTESLKEAIKLKKIGIKKDILILAFIDGDINDIKYALNSNIIFKISNIKEAEYINKIATILKVKAQAHIKIDTGMSRLGFNNINEIQSILNLKNIKLKGMFTHLADSQKIKDETFSYIQINLFEEIIKNIEKRKRIEYKHIYSSSSIGFLFKNNSIIRAGGLAYGLFKNDNHKHIIEGIYQDHFKQILTWKTYIIEIKSIEKGTFIGYNLTFKTDQRITIGIIPIGYYDGYPRELSNKGYVIINNQKAPIIGIISMNLTIINITNIKNVKLYSEVILTTDNNDISAHKIAKNANLITNEFITKIDKSITRQIV
jgi:alanine racemase